jgi:circadian clock protein KaiC
MDENTFIQTGIKGLDSIFLGGISRSNIILLEGVTGSGKSLMGTEFIYRGITEYNEPGIIVVFETSPDKLIRDASAFGWNLAELQEQNKLKIVFTTPAVFEEEMRSTDSLLIETANQMGAKRIFIDGVGLLTQIKSGDRSGPAFYREVLQQLVQELNRENLTAVLSHERGSTAEAIASSEIANYLMDTVIRLNSKRIGRRSHRSIEIVKSRGQDFESGEHTLRITPGKGLEVFRRVQAPVRLEATQPSSSIKQSMTGVAAVDALIGGGLFDGSTTMVVGVSGVGKTVLGTQFLIEGARKQNTRGLLISLDEHPAQIMRNALTLDLNLQELVNEGKIQILFESPQELDIDSHFARIVELIEKFEIQRVVIDGMTSYSNAVGDLAVYRDFFHALVAFSKRRLMTTFFNYENPEFLGISCYMPDFPVSSIVDNLLLMSLVEINSSLHRCISVVKARGCKHSFDTREFAIGQGGIMLLPEDASPVNTLPLQNYSSLLSRAPTRYVGTQRMGDNALAQRSK